MTERENYLKMLRGEMPEWIPTAILARDPEGAAPAVATVCPGFLAQHMGAPGEAKDIWGVNHVPVPNTPGAKLPQQGDYILKDITKWRDVIKAPDISDIDWEDMANKGLARVNREESCISLTIMAMPFMSLVSFMGFEEGLCAMYEEPDEVMEMLDYVTSFYEKVNEKCFDLYKPDIFMIGDDTATWLNPFFSVDMYREIIKPFHVRIAKMANERGVPVDMHCCGRSEDFIEDWRDFGVVSWNPAQTINNLDAIQAKYGRSFIINGAWDIVGRLQSPDVTEEEVKASVRESMDKRAKNGGYVFGGSFLGAFDDEATNLKNKWLYEEAKSYGRQFYK